MVKIFRYFFIILSLLSGTAFSQTTVGPNNPTAAADGGGGSGGVPSWSNASGTPYSSNNAYAKVTDQSKNKNTNYLHVTGFGFSIPAGSYIAGIKVEVEMYGTVPGGATNTEQSILLINASSARVGTDHSTGAILSTSDLNTYVTYGGASDNWGGVLTYADINSSNFGVALQYRTGTVNDDAFSYDFNVDHVRLTVYYTPGYDAVIDGNFNDGATWGRVSPGVAGIDYPDATIAASIPGGRNVTIATGTTANCYALIMNSNLSTSSPATLSLANSTATLNIADDILMQSTTSATASFAAGTISLNGGTINVTDDVVMVADRNGGNSTSQTIVFGGGTMTVNGDVTMSSDNAAATTTLNMTAANSTFNIAGAISFGTGASLTNGTGATGTVNYMGSAAQSVLNAITYFNLITSGGGLKTLGGSTTVKGTLTMTSGNINMNAGTLTLGSSTAASGTLSWTNGRLYNGSFLRWFNTSTIADNITSGAGLFPIGSSTDYRPLYVYWPTTGPSTGGTLSMTHTDPGTGPTTVAIVDGPSVIVRRTDMNWALTAANGFNIAANNLNVRISGTNIGTIGNSNDLRVMLSGSIDGTAGANGGTASDPIVKRTALSALTATTKTFYIGSVDAISSPLPIELISFDIKANTDHNEVYLSWETATETNNDFFTIERSNNGAEFESIGIIKGAGNSSTIRQYYLTDDKPLKGDLYYRIKQTDFDGKYTYSETKYLEFNPDDEQYITVFPNPYQNSDKLYLAIPHSFIAEKLLITVYNPSGGVIYSQKIDGSTQTIAIDNFGIYTPGVYLITVSSYKKLMSTKLIVN